MFDLLFDSVAFLDYKSYDEWRIQVGFSSEGESQISLSQVILTYPSGSVKYTLLG